MMAQKQSLHELLKQNQEPFHLKSYIADKRSQLYNSTTLQLRKRCNNLSRNVCFSAFNNHNSSDVGKSPILDFQSPAKSPNGAVFLHVPSKTAALLLEAAMRIQKQQQSKPKTQIKNVGFSLFGSFMKIMKRRSKKKNIAIGDNKMKVLRSYEPKEKGKSEEFDEINGDFALRESRFCSSPVSPFRFSGSRRSPAAPPVRHVKQEKENYATGEDLDRRVHGVQEKKEQCSPVSVLDPFFEDDGHERVDAEVDACDHGCNYANIERARQQLLNRLRRFEKLAALDPIELEQRLLEGSDDEYHRVSAESEDDEPLSIWRKQGAVISANEVFGPSKLQPKPRMMSAGMKKLVPNLIIKEKSKIIFSGNKEVALGRICNRLNSLREVEFAVIDMMVELNFTQESEGWKRFPEEVEEMAAEVELAIVEAMVKELLDELFYVDEQHQELDYVPIECR